MNVHYISNQNNSYPLHKYIYIEKEKQKTQKLPIFPESSEWM